MFLSSFPIALFSSDLRFPNFLSLKFQKRKERKKLIQAQRDRPLLALFLLFSLFLLVPVLELNAPLTDGKRHIRVGSWKRGIGEWIRTSLGPGQPPSLACRHRLLFKLTLLNWKIIVSHSSSPQSHDGPSEKLGEIKRSSGKPLNVEARCVNLRNFKDPEATLITCSYSGDNPIDAPIYTSFGIIIIIIIIIIIVDVLRISVVCLAGMMAHVARIRVDKFSSEAVKYSKTPSPKLVDMKLKPSSGSRFKQLWLMQFNREPGIVDLDTLTAAYGLLAENASSMGG